MKNLLIIFLALNIFNCDDNSQVIETLDGDKLTVKKFERAYETAIESMSRMQNVEKENLIKIISKDRSEISGDDQIGLQLYEQFQKKNFYETYRNALMVKKAADKSGFTSRADIKDIIAFAEMQTVNQLYITEQVEKKIQISEEEVKAKVEELRRDPKFKNEPLDRLTQYARGYIKAQASREQLPKVYERVKEGISIKHNDKFDLDQYFKSGIPENLKKLNESKTEGSEKK
jgi:hypothetical protein